MRKNFLACSVFALSLAGAANAQTLASGSPSFSGTIEETCEINMSGNGSLAPNATYTELSSFQEGATPASMIVTTNVEGMLLEVESPSTFSQAPSGYEGGAIFSTSYSVNGGAYVSERSDHTLDAGNTNVEVGITATQQNAFGPGQYAASSTVRCVAVVF